LSKDFLARPGGILYFDQLRQFFETSLVRYAAEHATDEQIKNLDEALKLNERSLGKREQFKKTDMNFHRVIAEIPGNPIFLAVHQALVDWVIAVRPDPEGVDQNELDQNSYQAHKRILEKIRDGDVDGADQCLREHLQYVSENYNVDK
jgi:DNA-binding FadR family transcriptional regulator